MKQTKSLLALALTGLFATPLAQAQVSGVDSLSAQTSILSAGGQARHVAQIRRVPSVGVINLSFGGPRLNDGNLPSPAEFRVSAEKNVRGIEKLHRALAANPATRAALSQHGVNIASVVGVDISSNGSLRIYKLTPR